MEPHGTTPFTRGVVYPVTRFNEEDAMLSENSGGNPDSKNSGVALLPRVLH